MTTSNIALADCGGRDWVMDAEKSARIARPAMPELNAFAAVVREHHASLRYFIRSLGVHADWVDDVAQDVFVIAYRKWDDLEQTDQAGYWLRAIARNVVMNEQSKAGRRHRLMDANLTSLLLEAESSPDAPESLSDRNIRHTALRDCLAKLPDRSREMVEARYFRDRNSQQIGEDLNLKATAVRKALFTARQLLADCLKRKSIGGSGQ